jgi:uncharacterized protein with HEPN domain
MLDNSREILSATRDRTRQDLDNDRILCLALTRLLEIVGEAASRVPEAERSAHPLIPWPEII